MAPITFEKMTGTHLKDVLAIERDAFSSPWTERMFQAELFENPFSFPWVMTQAQQIIGYLVYWEIIDEWHLMNLAIAPPWQRKGIGTAGICWIRKNGEQKGIQRIILEVRASNLPAQTLYRKGGFHEVARRKNYYDAPVEDAILLQCNLLAKQAPQYSTHSEACSGR